MATPTKLYAVITGDLVDSTHLPVGELEETREALLRAVQEVKGWEEGLVLSKSEFFRGDGWQVLLGNPALALRVAIFLRASMRARGEVDSRFSIGIGTVDQVSGERVSLSVGEAFQRSGRGLDNMTSLTQMTIEAGSKKSQVAEWLRVVGHLCDALIEKWTDRQAEIVRLATLPGDLSHEDIAARLSPSVSRQAVTKSLNAAGWTALRGAIACFEQTNWNKVQKGTLR